MGRLVFKQLMRDFFFPWPFFFLKKNWESTIVSRLSGRRDILPPHHFFLLRESLVLHFNYVRTKNKEVLALFIEWKKYWFTKRIGNLKLIFLQVFINNRRFWSNSREFLSLSFFLGLVMKLELHRNVLDFAGEGIEIWWWCLRMERWRYFLFLFCIVI